ncbi:MAG: hypothetical protein KKI12_12760 [Proteobacteria bacterium]|nr:hypothetical protein [Pseudomonadota bacterium]MBU4289027.1 hypothetical protein [Pseudomonadota bacterium]MBU4414484.1 hypothetical protein [Pseudomonadota bacterium]
MQKEKCLRILFSCIIFVLLAINVLFWGSILIQNVVTGKNIREADLIQNVVTSKNIREAERIGNENEQEKKRIIAEKLKIAKKECFKAYKTLKKIEASLESGVKFQNYSLAVNDARLELNMIIATVDKSFTLLFLTQLEEIFHFYQLGKTVWEAKITSIIEGREFDLGDVCYKIMHGRLIYYSEYRERILGIECAASFGQPYDSDVLHNCSDKLRQVLWLEASKRIREYEKDTLQSQLSEPTP